MALAAPAAAITNGLSYASVAQILDVPESKLRYWAQIGFVGPSGSKDGKSAFTFSDLVCVKAAKELVDRGFKTSEIRAALAAAARTLPTREASMESLLKLRVAWSGEALVVLDEGVAFEVSGQRLFDFGLAELAERAEAVRRDAGELLPLPTGKAARVSGAQRSAYDCFVEGLGLEGKGLEEEAASCYRQAVQLDPGLSAAHTNLGTLAYRRGDRGAARGAFEQALSLDPEQAEARFNLANLLIEDGEAELAASELRRVLQTVPDFADAHYNLATALEALGSRAQARAHLQEFLKLAGAGSNPDGEPVEEDPWVAEARLRMERLS
jgi:tetratricopeptide (TPR) repeat protein